MFKIEMTNKLQTSTSELIHLTCRGKKNYDVSPTEWFTFLWWKVSRRTQCKENATATYSVQTFNEHLTFLKAVFSPPITNYPKA